MACEEGKVILKSSADEKKSIFSYLLGSKGSKDEKIKIFT